MIDPRTPVPQTHKHLKRGQIAQSSALLSGFGGRKLIFKDASGTDATSTTDPKRCSKDVPGTAPANGASGAAAFGTGRELIFKDASGFGGRAFGPKLQSFSFGAAFDSGGVSAASAMKGKILGAMVPGGWCCGWPLLLLSSGLLLEQC